MQPHIDARKQTINNVRFTTLNLPPVSIAPRPPAARGRGTRFFQVLGALVWLLIAIVAIGRCSAADASDCLTFPDGRQEGTTCPVAARVPAGCESVGVYGRGGAFINCSGWPKGPGPGVIEVQAPEPPSGWIFPQGNGWIVPPQSPDTLRCKRLGAEFVCTDRRQETTCRLVGLEWVCDRRSRF